MILAGYVINPNGIPFSLLMVVAILGYFAALVVAIKKGKNRHFLVWCYTGTGLMLTAGVMTSIYWLGVMKYEPFYLLLFAIGSVPFVLGKEFLETGTFKRYKEFNERLWMWIFWTLFSIVACIIL